MTYTNSTTEQPVTNDEPRKVRVNVVLTEDQLYVITKQAKREYRSVDQMIQILLHEGWTFYVESHEIGVPCREQPENGQCYPKWYTDSETVEMMQPMVAYYE